MDENDKTDGRTAMERLARELMGAVVSCAPTVWCGEHGIVIHGTRPEQDREHARADIERRIAEARDEDLFKDDYMVRELKRMTGMHLDKDRCTTCGDVDEMVDAVEGWKAKAAELDALSEACRIMPEGMRWPRYEDGEPVRIGDECIIAGETRPITSIEFDASQLRVKCGSLGRIRDYGAPFKRPAPKAFGADGVEVKVGDTVWTDDGREWTVMKADQGYCRVREASPARGFFIEERYISAGLLTHQRPDSWERLHEDVRKDYTAYWGCIGFCCDKCPALVDGKKPNERYDTAGCHTAEQIDLLARAERLAGVQGE